MAIKYILYLFHCSRTANVSKIDAEAAGYSRRSQALRIRAE
jgi:hypothetical protein